VLAVAVAIPAMLAVNPVPASAQSGRNLREFNNVPRIGTVAVDRNSYSDNNVLRAFDAIVNDGNRQSWTANCRTRQLFNQNGQLLQSNAVDSIAAFVCTDRYTPESSSGNSSGNNGTTGSWRSVTVIRDTDAVTLGGRELFQIFSGERIQVNWSDTRQIDGRNYVSAIDSIGQKGYVRTDRISR
jgi:hypothetical protein